MRDLEAGVACHEIVAHVSILHLSKREDLQKAVHTTQVILNSDLAKTGNTAEFDLESETAGQQSPTSGPLSTGLGEDSRLVNAGYQIPSLVYTDQPYIVRTSDGAWLCVLTTGSKEEGQDGQHILSLRSEDCGKTWSEPVEIEPPSGPEASWAVALAAPSGRIFVFYVYNGENLRELPCGEGTTKRMDSHGDYVFRWSDDGGRTWSAERVLIPVRAFDIDRNNSTMGDVRLFWNVGRPIISKDEVFLPLHKVGGFGEGWFTNSEGAFVRSGDLLHVDDPSVATWETLPEGEAGLRTPADGGGPIAEEQCLLELSDGSFFCVYRSIDGHPVGCYSRNRGRTWEDPEYVEYWDGRRVKHPRAACFAWKLSSGSYVLWFHNHGGLVLGEHPLRRVVGYDDRNPVWMARGIEIPTAQGMKLVWENPEIVLYDDDPTVRMSYPDLCEDRGAIYLTETQKVVARVHKTSETLALALRSGANGFDPVKIRAESVDTASGTLPALPGFVARSRTLPYGTESLRQGFAIEFNFVMPANGWTGTLLRAWHSSKGGIVIECLKGNVIRATLSDGRVEWAWNSDAFSNTGGERHHVVINVDGGPRIVTFFFDGVLCDGGCERQFGWGRFSPYFRGLPAGIPIETDHANLEALHVYPRILLAAEVGALFCEGDARRQGGNCRTEKVSPEHQSIGAAV